MTALCIVQARMSSRRLPGKVLADVHGEPMLGLLLTRLARARRVSRIVVATSVGEEDTPIVALAEQCGVEAYRGPLEDVLERFVGAAGDWSGPVVRVTADCPLLDPAVVDETIEAYLSTPGVRYASNIATRTHPVGLDVEVVDPELLRELARAPLDAHDREHVTTAIRRDPERFPTTAITRHPPLGELRWTVDEPDDLAFVRAVVDRLGPRRHEAPLEDVLGTVRQPPSLAQSFGGARG